MLIHIAIKPTGIIYVGVSVVAIAIQCGGGRKEAEWAASTGKGHVCQAFLVQAEVKVVAIVGHLDLFIALATTIRGERDFDDEIGRLRYQATISLSRK